MTAPATDAEERSYQLTPTTIALLGVAALAWAGVVAVAREMGNGSGTMGLPLSEFLPMWSLMMTAMMLPAVAPVAALYVRTFRANPRRRTALFVTGYLLIWSAAGLLAFLLLRLVDRQVMDSPTAMRAIAVVVLVLAGVYQLSPLKQVCLRHCRSPLGQLLRYGNVKGATRDLKVALHHGGFCLGCCWGLMALFIAFGVMNIWVMLALTAVVVSEKVLRRGEQIGRLAGVGFLAIALLIIASPTVADRLVPSTAASDSMTEM